MDFIETLNTRTSVPPKILVEPAPDPEQLALFLSTALRAPDHGAIQPWRFHVIRGDARAKLGELFAQALLKREPDAPEAAVAKERLRPSFAPLAIVVGAQITTDNPGVPPVEQIVSTGAAIQNIMNAAHASGYATFLSTGIRARDAHIKRAFGFGEKDELVGFLYIGTPKSPQSVKPRPDSMQFTTQWTGPIG